MEAAVCASCPEAFHDEVAALCRQHGIQKAFGKAGDMVKSLSGKDWIPKWEAKVVMATVTKAQTMGAEKALIICIAGGKNCDSEMARQPHLVRAIKKEMEDEQFRVRVEWIEKEEFFERYSAAKGNAHDKKAADKSAASPEAKAKAEDKQAGDKPADSPPGSSNAGGQKQQQECRYYAKGACKNGAACPFAHKPPCSFFRQGKCKNGTACRFSHALDNPKTDNAKAKAKAKDADARLVCRECGKSFKDWDQMVSKHWFCKGREPLCACSQCNRAFDELQQCLQHQKDTGHKGHVRVNDTRDPVWFCMQCDREFRTEQACIQHQEATGHGDIPCCMVCLKTFGSKKAILQHQQSCGHAGIQWLLEADSDSEPDEDPTVSREYPLLYSPTFQLL
ncbi:unnamed protein product [Prorocentrum cordatum]|uniref:Cleavage and polyadenylation specificity factor subunit 4 n=1 Tax=Prorocentrum cordatum TaxID=2364126 RepID=A0ABN9TWB2_9DINO|nr:unnamed protein product [Polarella glacialis]